MDGTDHLEAGISVSTPVTESEGGKPKKPRKPRTKRPRPTFDDGALTRAFKFPSKTYPRSSYYVTSDEIIIRIKKAKKKWKLVVPKKRVVAYRTNRWFAKPRWIELELTFTQASRLGLVIAGKKTAPAETPIEAQVAADPIPENEATQARDAEADFDFEGMAAWQETFEPDVELDQPDGADEFDGSAEASGADDSDNEPESLAIDDGPVETSAEPLTEPSSEPVPCHLPQPEEAVADLAPPALQTTPLEIFAGPLADTLSILPRDERPVRRTRSYLLAASLAFLLVGVPAAWLAISDFSDHQLSAEIECPAAACSRGIVTGSIRQLGKPHEPKANEPVMTEVATPIERPEQTELNSSAVEPKAPEKLEVVAAVVPSIISNFPAGPAVELASALQPSVAAIPVACHELTAAGTAISIQFEYTKANLDRSVFRALDAFAERLRQCPTAKVAIEGHTDADGHFDRNEALSLRRAKAVLEYLVEVGANPDQLAANGFGQSRPLAPNDSPENKRNNRRAVLVVELPQAK
jgi:outer membrane protein OmpA-like peptidoglycan-associated protein